MLAKHGKAAEEAVEAALWQLLPVLLSAHMVGT